MNYYYCDPTGNITILVEEEIPVDKQPEISHFLCKLEPTCEQVGFVYFDSSEVDIRLRMAGGEFCGNATMTTAAFCCYKKNLKIGTVTEINVSASGTDNPVKVEIERTSKKEFNGKVFMPKPINYSVRDFEYKGKIYQLPIVMFEGMYHLILEEKMEKEDAEAAVIKWCEEMNVAGMGLMFMNEKEKMLTPLVYVPAIDAFYWENSCASGTTACGYHLYKKYGKGIDFSFKEPGGILYITVDKEGNPTLSGHVKIVEQREVSI